jgi:N-acetyl-anhydromuramyl-L-alanine amidase AmpD
MKIIDVRSKLPFKGSNGKLDPKKINIVVVHHDAVDNSKAYNTLTRITQEANAHVANGWKHISYHYVIDNVGDIYYCLDEKEVGYHAGNLPVNLNSIAVMVQGNYEIQTVKDKSLKALYELERYLTTQRPDLPKIVRESIKGHKEVRVAPTACPGRNLFPLIKKF